MSGFVDDRNRALISIRIANGLDFKIEDVFVWIDTAFDGHLVFSKELISKLELDSLVQTEAILADGSKVVMEPYFSVVDWFGKMVPVQVIENEGRFPLLGTGLLAGKTVYTNYDTKQVAIT